MQGEKTETGFFLKPTLDCWVRRNYRGVGAGARRSVRRPGLRSQLRRGRAQASWGRAGRTGRALGVGGEEQGRTAGGSNRGWGPLFLWETGCHSTGKGRRKEALATDDWVLGVSHGFNHCICVNHKAGIAINITLILEMKKSRHREGSQLAQGQTVMW